MDLKSFLPTKEAAEHYWSLVIEPGWVQAGIWLIEEGKVEVISISPPAHWESDEELIDAADTVLSAAIQNLPEDRGEPSKTVFGVPDSWVAGGQIKEEHLNKIKEICKNLSLEPVGFVVLSEAISNYQKSQEGSPLTAVVLGIGEENLEVSVFRLGNLMGSDIVARSVSFADDVAEGLSRFSSAEPFPSRFLLYDGKEGELEDVRQALTSVAWENYENLKFLHTPKIEIVTPEQKILATSLAGGLEMANVSQVNRLETEEEEEVEAASPPETAVTPTRLADLGFVVGEDVTAKIPAISKQPDGVKEEIPMAPPATSPRFPVEPRVETPIKEARRSFFQEATSLVGKPKRFLAKIFSLLSFRFLARKERREEASVPTNYKKIWPVAGAFFVLSFILFFIYWWYFPKAKVTIFVSPQKIEERAAFFIDPKAGDINLETRTFSGDLAEETASGEKTKSTTGTKTVGERAKGEVTLYRAGAEVELASGTVLVGPSELTYTLDDKVTIASGSASTPATMKAGVTAKDIGSQYNLAAGETFSVGNYPRSEIEAKNDNSFSGGSSREVSAVSSRDQEDLENELEEELVEKAGQNLESKVSEDKLFIKESITVKKTNRSFSQMVGDESSSLKLALALEISGLVIDKGQLASLAKEILKEKVSQNYVLRDDQIKTSFAYEGEENGLYKAEAILKANLLPEIKIDEIADKIKGKYPNLAEEYLTSVQGFTKAKITLNPRLPGRLGTLPRLAKNISIEIEAE